MGPSSFSIRHRLLRGLWQAFHLMFIRFSPRPCHAWRAMLLRFWGAKLGARCHIYPSAIIWAPWNLECGDDACIANGVEVYNVAPITLGVRAIVSQGAYLCAASHDYRKDEFPLTTAPIRIGARAWVAARAIVLMGVTIGERCVIAAGSVVARDMPAHAVCGGNPCRVIRENYHESAG